MTYCYVPAGGLQAGSFRSTLHIYRFLIDGWRALVHCLRLPCVLRKLLIVASQERDAIFSCGSRTTRRWCYRSLPFEKLERSG